MTSDSEGREASGGWQRVFVGLAVYPGDAVRRSHDGAGVQGASQGSSHGPGEETASAGPRTDVSLCLWPRGRHTLIAARSVLAILSVVFCH